MPILIVPQLADNFAYLLVDDTSRLAGVIDCAEAGKVLDEVKRHGLKLVAVLSTHWHGDHVGGNSELVSAIPGLRIYGARAENGRIPGLTDEVADGDSVGIGKLTARVIGIPAHTNGHVAYWFEVDALAFVGDTLFSIGCGRVIEGTPETMWQSLLKLRALPDDTLVYCGHEYTAANIRFAKTIEPGNPDLAAREKEVARLLAAGQATIPARLGAEKKANVFLRADVPAVAATVGLAGQPAAVVFAEVRARKNRF